MTHRPLAARHALDLAIDADDFAAEAASTCMFVGASRMTDVADHPIAIDAILELVLADAETAATAVIDVFAKIVDISELAQEHIVPVLCRFAEP